MRPTKLLMGWALLGAWAGLLSPPGPADASDHVDAPLTSEDRAADLADFYAWHTDRGTIVAVLTFAPLLAPGDDPVYDADTVYVIHIDNTADLNQPNPLFNDNQSDIRIAIRFGQNDLGEWGVQLTDVPGADDAVFDGPVEQTLTNGSAQAIAGVFDDPFFFDFEGFLATMANLTDDTEADDWGFAFFVDGAPVDFFAGLNTMAIVVEIDAAIAVDGNPDDYIQMWATSGVL